MSDSIEDIIFRVFQDLAQLEEINWISTFAPFNLVVPFLSFSITKIILLLIPFFF